MRVKVTERISVPDHIGVGQAKIPLESVNDCNLIYQGWLNDAGSEAWGNVNVEIHYPTMTYKAWLDYGPLQTSDPRTVEFAGVLDSFSQLTLNRVIGKQILTAYPYKETLKTLHIRRK